jgi:hypothetical protein
MTATAERAAELPPLEGGLAARGTLGAAASQSGVAAFDGKVVTLPSGKVAKIRKGKGRDIQCASRLVDPQRDGFMSLIIAIVARKTILDDQPITYEDLLDLDEDDAWVLINEGQSGKAPSPAITSPS